MIWNNYQKTLKGMEMKAAWLRIWNTKNDMMVSSLGFLFASPIPDQHPNRSMGTEQKRLLPLSKEQKRGSLESRKLWDDNCSTPAKSVASSLQALAEWGSFCPHQPDKASQPLAEEVSVKAKLSLSGNEILHHNVTGDHVRGLVF